MLVLHGLWQAERLLVWAEDSSRPPEAPARPGRPPRQLPHPFAADHESLTAALGPVAAKAAAGTTALLLPGRPRAPLPSPELIREDHSAGQGRPTLRPWQVSTLAYEPDEVPGVLLDLVDLPPGEVVVGAGVRHLAELATFACELVARGRLLPTVDPAGPAAYWRPVLTGADAEWARALALALPPAGRAGAPDGAGPERAAAPAGGVAPLAGKAAGKAPLAGKAVAGGEVAGGEVASAGEVVASALDTLVDVAARTAIDAALLTGQRRRRAGPSDAWLSALTGRQRRFDADPAAVRRLAAELEQWQRDAVGGAVRACFRLVEPAADDEAGQWWVEFALQPAEEPSLLVAAEQVWRSEGARALARYTPDPQETLLAELGRACRLWPELEPALRTARPEGLGLDAAGAHEFLGRAVPLLAGAGFGVVLPAWWSQPSARLGVRLTAHTPGQPGRVEGDSALSGKLTEFRWEVALGDDPLTEEELAKLTALKSPLVRIRGQWVQVDPAQLARGLAMLQRSRPTDLAELVQLAAGEGGPAGLPVTGVTATGWLADLLDGAEHRVDPATEPAGFAGTLRPYQRRGLAWLDFLQRVGVGGILADDMGLGKTATTLALIASDPPGTAPSLVVCPMSLVGNWQREAARFAPGLRVHVHHGAERARGEEFAAAVAAADLVITTYALVARDAEALATMAWRRVVADEAQAIKNAATRQAVAVRSLRAESRIAVTGTPVENRLADLWALMEFANPGLLGSAGAFKQAYAQPVERHGDEAAAARLRRLTQPFILRRVKTDRSVISDLPEKLEMDVLCNLTAEQASLYQAVVADMLHRIEHSDGIERRGLVLATMTKLKQVCNHPAQFLRDGSRLAGRSGKLARLEEILEEVLAAGERALLFTQYAEFGGLLRAHLSARFGREVGYLHGGLRKAERDELVARFQSADPTAPPLFVLSLKAGGTGLTLTAANHVIHVDRWWNPAVEDQATDRAFRIGQKRDVQVRKLICAGTLEEKISSMITEKRGLAAAVVGSGEQWLTELSTADLRSLFALEKGAAAE